VIKVYEVDMYDIKLGPLVGEYPTRAEALGAARHHADGWCEDDVLEVRDVPQGVVVIAAKSDFGCLVML
jgi:hypothetical protein